MAGNVSPWESAVLPSEEMFKIHDGIDGGWPYYYYDHIRGKKYLNPEYGGDKVKEGNGAKLTKPVMGFPGHFAPNDLLFYKGNQLPARYKKGAFVVLHGSTIRQPYPQAGYFVAFVPMEGGKVTGLLGGLCKWIWKESDFNRELCRLPSDGYYRRPGWIALH